MQNEIEPVYERLRLAVKKAVDQFMADGALTYGAAFSFYMALSLAPLVMVSLWGVKLVWGQPAAGQPIIAQAQQFFGTKGAQTISKIIGQADNPGVGIFALVTGLVVGLLGSTGVFIQLQQSLDCIHNVTPDPNRRWAELACDRLIALVMVLLIGLLLLVSLVLTAVLSAVNIRLQTYIPGVTWLWRVIEFIGGLAIVTALFACVYRFLPHIRISWRQVWLGAFVAALLYNVGHFLTGLYLGCSGVDSASDKGEAVVAVAVWEYYSTLVILFGAELAQAYARVSGMPIQPARHAPPTEVA